MFSVFVQNMLGEEKNDSIRAANRYFAVGTQPRTVRANQTASQVRAQLLLVISDYFAILTVYSLSKVIKTRLVTSLFRNVPLTAVIPWRE